MDAQGKGRAGPLACSKRSLKERLPPITRGRKKGKKEKISIETIAFYHARRKKARHRCLTFSSFLIYGSLPISTKKKRKRKRLS